MTKSLMRAMVRLTALAMPLAFCTKDPASPSQQSPPPAPAPSGSAVTSVGVIGLPSSMTVGQRVTVAAVGRDRTGEVVASARPTWISSSTAVLSVDADGGVVALAAGGATVTATIAGVTGSAATQVLAPARPAVASVAVSPDAPSITVGQEVRLTALVRDASGAVLSDRAVAWVSRGPVIATVSDAGLVRGITPGTVTVEAIAEGISGAARVTVTPAGGGTGTPPTGGTVRLTPSTLRCLPGESVSISAAPVDAAGAAAPGPVIFSSSAPSVASVASTGVYDGIVRCASVGSAVITAAAPGRSGTATVVVSAPQPPTPTPTPTPRTLTIAVTNQLLAPVNVTVNGTVVGSVPAQSTRQTTTTVANAVVGWSLVRPVLGGQPLGVSMSGSFASVTNTGQTVAFTVDNDVGGTPYFAPLVTNRTATTLLLGVNMGLNSENRCNCTASVGASRVFFGYYRLFSNSNVQAFRSGSGYVGRYTYFDGFSGLVQQGSGAIELTFTLTP
ncbi:Ig-like domain-containing protein [Roseisolibacter sp. H3M3-2]|uniref:Ig-like domain-containing protein n=1 Tax=Roseisolibacter sp. H3M3-2 TaxID=3031323 RepID=UPI0023DAEAE9|nr:Ig-like domain-containing protein [Roseisolibacter sp. H3M3-2]MDF1502431.1 Ig-like domain-containing protein [Roseisolibacter sp. H3M3-2]